MKTDPFTLDVIQQALTAIAEEMFVILKRASMSPIIYEVLDVGTGITDPDGEMVSSGAGIPGFIGVLDKSVRHRKLSAKKKWSLFGEGAKPTTRKRR